MSAIRRRPANRGIHVYLRIEPRWTFTEVRRAAIAFAREIERRVPDLVTTAWWKEERGERVFVDFNQNARDRTIASAYSVRRRSDATVSAPLTWDELPSVQPEDFTIVTMPPRFAELGDVHASIDDVQHSIEPLLEWYARDERDRGLGDMPYPAELPEDARRAEARPAVQGPGPQDGVVKLDHNSWYRTYGHIAVWCTRGTS